MNGWWHNTTTERRLAQLDAGIELGMTAAQIAMVSGASKGSVLNFAQYHERSVPIHGNALSRKGNHRGSVTNAMRREYFSGASIDFATGHVGAPSDDVFEALK